MTPIRKRLINQFYQFLSEKSRIFFRKVGRIMSMEKQFYTEEIKKFVDEISTDNVNGLRFLVILYDFVKPMLSKIRVKGGVA